MEKSSRGRYKLLCESRWHLGPAVEGLSYQCITTENIQIKQIKNSTMVKQRQKNFNGSDPDGLFILPDKNSFLAPYGPISETSVVKFVHLCFHAVIFIFYF